MSDYSPAMLRSILACAQVNLVLGPPTVPASDRLNDPDHDRFGDHYHHLDAQPYVSGRVFQPYPNKLR